MRKFHIVDDAGFRFHCSPFWFTIIALSYLMKSKERRDTERSRESQRQASATTSAGRSQYHSPTVQGKAEAT